MPSVAQHLKDSREKQGLSISDVAELTKMKSDHIRALEEGNYDVFSAPVFIRGFVRNYGSILKLDHKMLQEQLDQELGKTQKFREPPALSAPSNSLLDALTLVLSKVKWSLVLPVLILFFILISGTFIIRTWQNYKSRDPLAELKPGLYKARATYINEFLPVKMNSNSKNPAP